MHIREIFMKKRILSLFLALFLLLTVVTIPATGLADAGSFSGDADFGGGWDSGSSWNSGSSWDDDDDYGASGGSFLFFGGGGGGGGSILILALIVLFIIFMSKRSKKAKSGPVAAGARPTAPPKPIADFRAIDSLFSEEEFKEKLSNLYVRMQNCWMNDKWEEMRPYLTGALYGQMEGQLKALKSMGRTNIMERIAVLDVVLTGYDEDEINHKMYAILNTRIVDYTVDADGNVVSGSKTAEKFMTYEWQMIRSKKASTRPKDDMEAMKCPSCGAPMDLNHSARCEFCDTVVTASDYDWVLSAIKGISQRTVNR